MKTPEDPPALCDRPFLDASGAPVPPPSASGNSRPHNILLTLAVEFTRRSGSKPRPPAKPAAENRLPW